MAILQLYKNRTSWRIVHWVIIKRVHLLWNLDAECCREILHALDTDPSLRVSVQASYYTYFDDYVLLASTLVSYLHTVPYLLLTSEGVGTTWPAPTHS